MTALIGLVLGMVIGVAARELWARQNRARGHQDMEQICRDWADQVEVVR